MKRRNKERRVPRKSRKGIGPLSPPVLVENPAQSEAQRRYLNAEFGHDWVKEHGFDNHGKLPEYKGTSNALTDMSTKRIVNGKKHLACNRAGKYRTPNVDPSKLDPTRTLTMRRYFFQELRKRFARLKGKILRLIVVDDVFGLNQPDNQGHFDNATLPIHNHEVLSIANCRPGQMRDVSGKCGPGIGVSIPRDKMPQIREKDIPQFIQFANLRGTNITKTIADVSDLSPTQANFQQERVDSVKDEHMETPIIISRDNYILDGTHRWIKAWQTDRETLPVLKVGLDLYDALDLMRAFPNVKYSTNTRWAFQSNPQQLRAFQSWLDQQIKSELLDDSGKGAWDSYIQAGYRKGAGRAFDDTNRSNKALAVGDRQKLDFYSGNRDQFLRDSFAHPVAQEKVELLAQRAFDEMENITDDMSTKISRTLTDGLVEGKGPREVADDLLEQVDISATRAKRIANTEIIRAHAEGQLTALENLGVEEVGVIVEFTVSGLDIVDKKGRPISPCERCKAMAGVTLKIEEARNVIPVHPECKCCWMPANVGEDQSDQKSSKGEIDKALDEADIDLDIDPDRPESILNVNPNHDEKGRFTSAEAHAIKRWTGPESDHIKAADEGVIPSSDLHKNFHSALQKIPQHEGDVYRGLHSLSPEKAMKMFNVGDEFTLPSTSSGSSSKELAHAYAMRELPGKGKFHELAGVVLHAKTKTAADLRGLEEEHLKHEDEIILRKGTKYRIVKIDDKMTRRMDDDDEEYGKPRLIRHVHIEEVPTSNTNPNHDEHGRFASGESSFAHLNDSSLKRMAKKAGIKHDGTRTDMEKKLHEYMNPGTTDKGSGLKGREGSPESSSISRGEGTKPITLSPSFDKAQTAQSITKTVDRLGQENYGLVHLGELHKAHSELSKEQLHSAIQHARKEGKLSLVPAEGRGGTTEHDRQSMIHEPDPVSGHTHDYLYVSVRNTVAPWVENVFCPKGKGGGVDPTCKKPEGSRVSDPHERDLSKVPTPKPFKEPPPKKAKAKGAPLRAKGAKSQTALGDKTEDAATKIGFRNILPEGKRTFTAREVEEYGSSIDLEYDHSGKLYELKMCKTTSTEYRLKAKLEEKKAKEQFAKNVKATVHTLIGVYDEDKGECHFYGAKEPGLTGAEVSEDKFHYFGKAKM